MFTKSVRMFYGTHSFQQNNQRFPIRRAYYKGYIAYCIITLYAPATACNRHQNHVYTYQNNCRQILLSDE